MLAIEVFKGWAESIRQDVDAFKAVLESKQAEEHARKLAGGALAYLVSKLDLIPDWNEGIGMIDDVMVLRTCAQLIQDYNKGPLPAAAEVSLERMANEGDKIKDFLGGPIFDKLKAYCAKLEEQPVRGRTPIQLADDAALRKTFYGEIDDELKKTVPIVMPDPKDAELRLKSYLTQKLK